MSRHQKANVCSTTTDEPGSPIEVSPARLEFEALEFARTEPLPDPATLTIGQMIELVTLVVRLRDKIAHPVFSLQSLRRADVLENSPGFSEFMGWVERKADPTNLIESAHKFRDGLSNASTSDIRISTPFRCRGRSICSSSVQPTRKYATHSLLRTR